MPANPSPAPEVLARLAELDAEAYYQPRHADEAPYVSWQPYRRALEAALTALAAATREAETLREKAEWCGSYRPRELTLTLGELYERHQSGQRGEYISHDEPMRQVDAALAPRSPEGEGR